MVAGFAAASVSLSTATGGDARSGLPKPRSITSSPARRSSSFSWSVTAKTYGGSDGTRRNSIAPKPAAVALGREPERHVLEPRGLVAWTRHDAAQVLVPDRSVTGPTPSSTLSTARSGVTSAAVPDMNTSSAR